ncbi:trans-sulfuration enzyme family protein [Shimia haliotis]|uniref:Methionine-gamma-lyase n=1 Tax=Shimia haliotis TaxID=1280847 RepID=A0A1I4CR91_9RHOB|nr:PLP-dependent aspartate aminotransferase family protein [Shimia haliotis]SFK82471.1 methionine-gamma-lyase [Shimia haliotis]
MTHRNSRKGVMTTAIHAGEAPDPATGASAPPLHMSSTFVTDQVAGFSAHDLEENSAYLYARWGNPTVQMLEKKLAALEGVEDCLCVASGMAAATAIFLTFLSAGDHAIVSDVSYAGVAELARDTLPRFGIAVDTVNMSDPAAVAAAIRPNTKLIHTETPVNPIGRLTDLAAISAIAKDAGALLSCDATFASPLGQNCAELGVDLIMHSVTKYIGGHGDAVGGAVAGSKELIAKMRAEASIHHGGVMSPFNAWLIARGLSLLPLRMKAHETGAQAVAEWLETRDAVTRVIYPGLKSHPQYDLAQQQMTNMSAMISFQVGNTAQGEATAQAMIEKLETIHYAVSLGHHRSLIFWMGTDALMDTSFRLSGDQLASYRAFAGDGIFRLSVGLEDADDLIADLAKIL